MATRRKYKIPHFRDGGRVMQDVPIAGDEPTSFATEEVGFPAGILGDHLSEKAGAPLFAPPPAEPSQQPQDRRDDRGDAADDNPLQRALHAQQHAEALQHEAAQRPQPSSAIEHHIEKIPGLSEHKRAFLKQFPVLVQDRDVMAVFNKKYAEALQSGFTDDTPEMDSHLITETVREIEHRRQLALASESEEQAVQKLDDEAAALMRSEQPPAPTAPPPAAPPKQRRVVYSAPVSKDSYMPSGQRRDDSNTLRADEREIARVSFPHLPAAQAEYEYLKNKRRMFAMKASGEIQGDR